MKKKKGAKPPLTPRRYFTVQLTVAQILSLNAAVKFAHWTAYAYGDEVVRMRGFGRVHRTRAARVIERLLGVIA